MYDAGNRRPCAGTDISRGPRNGSRGGDAAKERGCQIGDALRDQLHIGIMPVAGHAVGHDGRQQAFHRRQQRDRQGGRKQRQH